LRNDHVIIGKQNLGGGHSGETIIPPDFARSCRSDQDFLQAGEMKVSPFSAQCAAGISSSPAVSL
jgi:hypothetical protein